MRFFFATIRQNKRVLRRDSGVLSGATANPSLLTRRPFDLEEVAISHRSRYHRSLGDSRDQGLGTNARSEVPRIRLPDWVCEVATY